MTGRTTVAAAPDAPDFRQTETGRRQSWHGAKRYVKRFLAMRAPNAAMRAVVRLRPSINARGRLPAPHHVAEVRGEIRGSSFVMLNPARCVIAKELYWGDGVRPGAADRLALDVFATLATGAGLVIDIGAYTGLFTLASARVNPTVPCHAFELVPDVFRLLFDNCVRNDILDRTTLHPTAIGHAGSVVVPGTASGSALPDFYSTRLHFTDGVHVRVAPLDELLDQAPDAGRILIKIDVEGSEAEVLASGRGLLAKLAPDILCEVLPASTPAAEVEGVLGPGYHFYLVRERDLLACDRIQSPSGYRDWLFSHRSVEQLAELGIAVTASP
jgi:FkbM family methyltransferase